MAFSILPATFDQYEFYQNFSLQQVSNSNLFSSSNFSNLDRARAVVIENGCRSDFEASNEIIVNEPLSTPILNCGASTLSSVSFQWSTVFDATAYEISINGSAFQSPSSGILSTSETITGLNPNDIVSAQVRALGPAPCGDVISTVVSCSAQPCDAISVSTSADTTLCEGESATLALGITGTNSFSIDYNGQNLGSQTSLNFTPTADTSITIEVSNLNQPTCPNVLASYAVIVNEVPMISLSKTPLSDTICENATAIYTASNSSFTNYQFFNNGLLVQNGQRSFWSAQSSLNDSVYAFAENSGCVGPISNVIETQKDLELPPPTLSCGNSTDSSVSFVWNGNLGFDSYLLSVNGGAPVSVSTGSFQLGGLNVDDTAYASLTVISNSPCANTYTVGPVVCRATNCNAISFQLPQQSTLCEGDTLEVELSSLSTSNFSYSVNGGANQSSPRFDVVAAADTFLQVTLIDSNQLNCPSVQRNLFVNYTERPIVNLLSSINQDSVCSGQLITLSAVPAIFDSYEFVNSFNSIQNGVNASYTSSSWSTTDSIFVIATENGCAGPPSLAYEVEVIQSLAAPQVNCSTTTTSSVSFAWSSVASSLAYEVSVDGGNFISPSSGFNGLSHSIAGLNAGDSVSLRVRAIGGSPCGNSMVSTNQTCIAQNCTGISFDLTADTAICENESVNVQVSNLSIPNFALSFNGQASVSPSISISPNQDTLIQAQVTNTSQPNCPASTQSVSIDVNPIPVLQISTSTGFDTLAQMSR